MVIVSKKEAEAAGLPEYFSGLPCNLGMISFRLVKANRCQCAAHKSLRADNARKRYLASRSARIAKQKAYALENPDKVKANAAKHYQANKDIYKERAEAWVKDNQERRREIASAYATRNPDRLNANVRMRQAKKQKATPKWLTAEDKAEIKEMYSLAHRIARETGIPMHVDHVIPLRGKMVSGLHVPSNMQIIPALSNRNKGNKFDLHN